jgi:hypothetical protein
MTEARQFPQDLSCVTGGLDYVALASSGNRSTCHFPHVGVRPLEQLGDPWRVGAQALPKAQYCDVCFASATVGGNPLLNFAENIVVVRRDRLPCLDQALLKTRYAHFRKHS